MRKRNEKETAAVLTLLATGQISKTRAGKLLKALRARAKRV